jgi:hypothetical protein
MSALAHPPPSTGKKKKARRVFGDVIVDDTNNSLSYSPSPLKFDDNDELSNSKNLTTLDEDDKSINASNKLSFPCNNDSLENIVISQNKENKVVPTKKKVSFSDVASRKEPRHTVEKTKLQEMRSPMRPDLVKKTQDAINRASESVRKTLNDCSTLEKNMPVQTSVNPSLMAARHAKIALIREKSKVTAKTRQEWQEIAYDAKSFHNETEQYRLEMLGIQRQLSSRINKQRAVCYRERKHATLQKIDEESQFRSAVYRDHQKKLREERDRDRRMSQEARAKLRENHEHGIGIMKMQQIQEESAIHEERYATSLAIKETNDENALRRRKSFAFRSDHAKRIREIFRQMDSQKTEMEHESFELKRAAEKDAELYQRTQEEKRRESMANRAEYFHQQRTLEAERLANEKEIEHQNFQVKQAAEKDSDSYLKSIAEQRRKSLANRNNYAYKQRIEEQGMAALQHAKVHQSYELNRAAEKDAELYKRQLQIERRESFANRGEEARRIQQQQNEENSTMLAILHDSAELERDAAKDAEAYKGRLEQERRDSLARRNKESARHAKVMAEIEALAREKETESFVLKWAGESDAKAYIAAVSEERRKSLQLRGDENKHHRQIEKEKRQQELEQQRKDEDMRSADAKDVQSYHKECAERHRRSLMYRGTESQLRRLRIEEDGATQRREEEESFQMETQAWFDVQEFVEECNQRRRLSLAFRAKEKRRQAAWERKRVESDRNAYSKLVRDRLADQRHVEAARQKERARIALEAIDHLERCSKSSYNPFASLLE